MDLCRSPGLRTRQPGPPETGEKKLEDKEKDQENGNEQEYEKICHVCRRTESRAGQMFDLPGGICMCYAEGV